MQQCVRGHAALLHQHHQQHPLHPLQQQQHWQQQHAAGSRHVGAPPPAQLQQQPYTQSARRVRARASEAGQEQQLAAPPAFTWGSSCAIGPRPTMEDEICLQVDAKAGFTFAAVFDGHGGTAAAQWLQQHLYEDVMAVLDQRAFLQPDPAAAPVPGRPGTLRPTALQQRLVDVFQQADEELLQYLLDTKGRVTGASGATTTVALVHPQRAVFASLGDSLAVLCRAGAPLVVTAQHRVYGFGEGVADEIARVEAAGGWIHDGRVCNILAVSRAFGDPEFKGEGLRLLLAEGAEKGSWPSDFAAKHTFDSDPVIPLPDVSMVELQPGADEFLVVATDGLWDCMPPPEAIRFARSQFQKGKTAQGVADALVEIALKRYTTDNVAVVVADLGGREARQKAARAAGQRRKGLLSGLFGGGGNGKG